MFHKGMENLFLRDTALENLGYDIIQVDEQVHTDYLHSILLI